MDHALLHDIIKLDLKNNIKRVFGLTSQDVKTLCNSSADVTEPCMSARTQV